MPAKKSPFSGISLSEQVIPDRTTGRDQRLFQETTRQPSGQEVSPPTIQQSDQPTSQEAGSDATPPANQPNGQHVGKPKSPRQSYPKRTYHLNPETVTLLEDMQRTLKRRYGVKRSLMEEIVEIAVAHLNEDFENNQQGSYLVSKLTS